MVDYLDFIADTQICAKPLIHYLNSFVGFVGYLNVFECL